LRGRRIWARRCSDNAADGGGDSEWTKFGWVVGIFVEAEEVGVAEVWSYFGGDGGCEDGIEEEREVCVDDLIIKTDQPVEGVD